MVSEPSASAAASAAAPASAAPPGASGRAVVLVGNPAAPYSRALRVARSLAELGYQVEIAAITAEGLPDREADGPVAYRRYRPSGFFARLTDSYRRRRPATPINVTAPMPIRVARAMAGRWRKVQYRFVQWVFFPHTVRGWWRTLARELPPADLYHACGSLTLAAALDARRRDRRARRRSVVIYDSIDIVMEGNNVRDMPRLVCGWLASRERRWARAADAMTTVNDPLADRLVARMGLQRRPTVVPNYPEPWTALPEAPDLIRHALGLPAATRIVLFQGRLGPNLGLDESAEAIRLVPDAALVLLGFGRWMELCQQRDHDPRYKGRHFTLPAQHPDELLRWTASADVVLVPLPANSFNQRYSTPNKFLEAIGAGTPVVLGPDLPAMEGILRQEDFGRVARSLGPEDLAAAIQSILGMPGSERDAWRIRIASAARERYSWPVAAANYRSLVRELQPASATRT